MLNSQDLIVIFKFKLIEVPCKIFYFMILLLCSYPEIRKALLTSDKERSQCHGFLAILRSESKETKIG